MVKEVKFAQTTSWCHLLSLFFDKFSFKNDFSEWKQWSKSSISRKFLADLTEFQINFYLGVSKGHPPKNKFGPLGGRSPRKNVSRSAYAFLYHEFLFHGWNVAQIIATAVFAKKTGSDCETGS